MSVTAQTMIEEARRYLMAQTREPMNLLAADVDTSTNMISFTYPLSAIQAGAYVSLDLEVVYVWSVDSAALTATVQRGMLGSPPAAHTSGALCTVNPRFPDWAVFQALNAELDSLCSPANGLFDMKYVELTYSPAVLGYDLTGVTDLIDVYDVRYQNVGPDQVWPEIKWRLKPASNTTTFPSGLALVLLEAAQAGFPVHIVYKGRFEHLTSTTDDVAATTGLPVSAYDIPPLGAAMRLQLVREGQRSFNESQPETRRADEVPPGAQLMGARGLQQLWTRRVKEEAAGLAKLYPDRRRQALG